MKVFLRTTFSIPAFMSSVVLLSILSLSMLSCTSQPKATADRSAAANKPSRLPALASTVMSLPLQTAGNDPRFVIENLRPQSTYKLEFFRGIDSSELQVDENLQAYYSTAVFRANSKGVIDIKTNSPLSGYDNGAYRGADAFGPLWSMQKLSFKSLPPSITEDVRLSDSLLKNLTFDVVRILVTENSSITQIIQLNYPGLAPGGQVLPLKLEDVKFKGTLVLPPPSPLKIQKKLPGLILWHGSDGAMPISLAKYFASKGFAALAIQYFTFDPKEAGAGLPQDLRQVPLELVENAIDWLARRPDVDAKKIAVLGSSRGGEMALIAGQLFAKKLLAVVAERPMHYHFGSKAEVQNKDEVASWTFRGQDLPYVSMLNKNCKPTYLDEITDTEGRNTRVAVDKANKNIETYRFRRGYLKVIDNHRKCGVDSLLKRGQIDTKKISVPILVTAGTDDQIWPADIALKDIQKEREQAGFKKDRFILFKGAGHVGGVPGMPRVPPWKLQPFSYKPNISQSIWVYGGTAKINSDATRKFTEETLKFLRETAENQK